MLSNAAQGVSPASELQTLTATEDVTLENLQSDLVPEDLDLYELDDNVISADMMDAQYIQELELAKKKLLARKAILKQKTEAVKALAKAKSLKAALKKVLASNKKISPKVKLEAHKKLISHEIAVREAAKRLASAKILKAKGFKTLQKRNPALKALLKKASAAAKAHKGVIAKKQIVLSPKAIAAVKRALAPKTKKSIEARKFAKKLLKQIREKKKQQIIKKILKAQLKPKPAPKPKYTKIIIR